MYSFTAILVNMSVHSCHTTVCLKENPDATIIYDITSPIHNIY